MKPAMLIIKIGFDASPPTVDLHQYLFWVFSVCGAENPK
jgi:hypothetical protein